MGVKSQERIETRVTADASRRKRNQAGLEGRELTFAATELRKLLPAAREHPGGVNGV